MCYFPVFLILLFQIQNFPILSSFPSETIFHQPKDTFQTITNGNSNGNGFNLTFCFKLETNANSDGSEILPLLIEPLNENIFISIPGGKLRAFSLKTKELLWETFLGGEIIGLNQDSSSISQDLYVLTETKEKGNNPNFVLRILGLSNGITKKEIKLSVGNSQFNVVFGKDIVFLSDANILKSYSLKTGEIMQSYRFTADITTLFRADNSDIYIQTGADRFSVLANQDGKTGTLKEFSIDNKFGILQSASPDGVLFTDAFGGATLYSITKQKKIWQIKQGAGITKTLHLKTNTYLMASNDNFLYLFRAKTGKRLWQRRLEGRPNEVKIIDSRIILVSIAGSSQVFVFSAENGKPLAVLNTGLQDYPIQTFSVTDKYIAVPTTNEVIIFCRP